MTTSIGESGRRPPIELSPEVHAAVEGIVAAMTALRNQMDELPEFSAAQLAEVHAGLSLEQAKRRSDGEPDSGTDLLGSLIEETFRTHEMARLQAAGYSPSTTNLAGVEYTGDSRAQRWPGEIRREARAEVERLAVAYLVQNQQPIDSRLYFGELDV
jgi:hypothetical protein